MALRTTDHARYDAYGGSRPETNAAVDHLIGYTGREWHAEADLQYNRARWYDPAVGRWLSEDPIGFEAGDANLSWYVGNIPTMRIDPSGLQETLILTDEQGEMQRRFYGRNRQYGGIALAAHGSGQTAGSSSARETERAQFRMDYLQRVLGEMLRLGDYMMNNPEAMSSSEYGLNEYQTLFAGFNRIEWPSLRMHMEYARSYNRIADGNVALTNGSSFNNPFWPGITLGREGFYGGTPEEPYGPTERAIMELIHEPMHDITRMGFFHTYPDALRPILLEPINDVVGPYTTDNYFSRWLELLEWTRHTKSNQTLLKYLESRSR